MEKYSRAGQAIDENIIWRMRISYCINKATHTHTHTHTLTDYVILIASQRQ